MREDEEEESLSGGRAGRERSPQPGITLPSQPRDRNQQEPTCQPRARSRCLPMPRAAQGRALLSPASAELEAELVWGLHHGSKRWQCQRLLVRTVAMPEIASASSSNAGVCRRAATQSTMGLAQHQPLQTPQTIFPLPGHVIA